jgi:protein-serine/threonine kinase
MSQPKGGKNYNISEPIMQGESDFGRPSANQVPAKFAQVAGFPDGSAVPEGKTHKRSNTIGGIFSRTNSIFGGKRHTAQSDQPGEKIKKSYPPVSMSGAVGQQDTPRQSMDSRRSISFGFGKKRSGSIAGSNATTLQEKPRRFSLLPTSFSLKAIGIGKEYGTPGTAAEQYDDLPESRGNYLDQPQVPRGPESRNISGATSNHPYGADRLYDGNRDSPVQERRGTGSTGSPVHQRYASQPISDPRSGAPPQFLPPLNFRQGESALTTESESSLNELQSRRGPGTGVYPPGFNEYEDGRRSAPQPQSQGRQPKGVLQKSNRRFNEARSNEQDQGNGYVHADHAGSSGPARRVMDFFRRRARDRGQ